MPITNKQLAQVCLGLSTRQITRINERFAGMFVVQQEFNCYERPPDAHVSQRHYNNDGSYSTTEYITVYST